MTNRRQVLQLGANVATLSILPAGTFSMASAPVSHLTAYRVLHDSRFTGSESLARSLASSFDGMPGLVAIDGDITRFLLGGQSRPVQEGPHAFAGVTGEDVLFCLEQLARDHRLRVHWRETVNEAREGSPALTAWLIAGR